eukprot:13760176-Heterocapsa_arctica.AAC.1
MLVIARVVRMSLVVDGDASVAQSARDQPAAISIPLRPDSARDPRPPPTGEWGLVAKPKPQRTHVTDNNGNMLQNRRGKE